MERAVTGTSGAHEVERVLHSQTHTSFLISDILDSAPRSRCSVEDSGDEHSAELNSEEANSDDDKASDIDADGGASAGMCGVLNACNIRNIVQVQVLYSIIMYVNSRGTLIYFVCRWYFTDVQTQEKATEGSLFARTSLRAGAEVCRPEVFDGTRARAIGECIALDGDPSQNLVSEQAI